MNVEKKGFTLTELLAVIAIISILALMAVPAVIKIYNDSVIKTMHVQEKKIKDAANLFVEDYCNDPLDHSLICPQSYSKPVNNKKVVCLSNLQNSKDKYISSVKYKDSDCKGYVTYYLDENTGIYGNEKTYLFCGLKEDGTYEYVTDNNYDIKEYCSCNDDDICEDADKNTYCTFDGEMVQGAEYVNGQYTYRYMQEGSSSKSGFAWKNISDDGWGVHLTDKTSTDPVTSKLCTYINNKPVISMSSMFSDSSATTLDLSSFNTSNVTNMSDMFSGSSATTLDLSSFNTSNVTNMSGMFFSNKATTLDLNSFDTSKVTDMSFMFSWSSATILDLSSFDTSNVTNMSWMFSDSEATTIELSSFDTSNVTNMSDMFSGSSATTLDLSSFNTSNVTNMSDMFFGSSATTLDLSSFNTSNVTDMSWMFAYSVATTLDLSSFNTKNVNDMSFMFDNSSATTIDLSGFDTSKVTDMERMFYLNSNLKTIYASDNFNTNAVTSSAGMFDNSTNLVGGAGTTYNRSYVDKTYARIDGGTSSPGYFTSK